MGQETTLSLTTLETDTLGHSTSRVTPHNDASFIRKPAAATPESSIEEIETQDSSRSHCAIPIPVHLNFRKDVYRPIYGKDC